MIYNVNKYFDEVEGKQYIKRKIIGLCVSMHNIFLRAIKNVDAGGVKLIKYFL